MQILEVKRLQNKQVTLVKVLWRSQRYEEATWEPEEKMRAAYPFLFTPQCTFNFEDEDS